MQKNMKIIAYISILFTVILIVSLVTAWPNLRRLKQCNDKIDNDGDGYIDMQDPQCSSRLDNNEDVASSSKCDGLNYRRLQGCCSKWVRENGIITISCVGEWVIENNRCAWECY